MRIGYSFWGFLGSGITDTPDGGRSHRRPLIDALIACGHEVVFLQADRDRIEAGDDLGGRYRFASHGFPDIDVLFCEWRWPIPGRNTTACGSPAHTCDLHRQNELIGYYTRVHRTPTVIWDKDRWLPVGSPWRRTPGVYVCEAALAPTPGAHRLLFPVDDVWLDSVSPAELAAAERRLALAYVGNQYDRDDAFERFFAPAAAHLPHAVGGKWTDTTRWPHVDFLGRLPFADVERLYSQSLATVLLLPQRYAAVGQMTQRIFEAVLAGCLPLAPSNIRHVETFVPEPLIVNDGQAVLRRVGELQQLTGTPQHIELLRVCLKRLELFRLSTQITVLDRLLKHAVTSNAPGLEPQS